MDPRPGPEPHAPRKDSSSADWDLVNELVFSCLEHDASDRAAALERVCSEHPHLADRVRRCLDRLADSGLTEGLDEDENAEFGAFRILRRLGGGGMGVVDLALQPDLDRMVALKRIRPEMLASKKARERFLREARAAARLAHPAICPVYEAGEHDGVPYLVMPFLHGETVAQRIAAQVLRESSGSGSAGERRTAVTDWVRLFELTAQGLHVAHESGLVHRDMKPANVMITDDLQPVILDFGLARATDSDDPSLTASGALVGTLPYMAPEQLAGDTRGVDRRTDVYALGVSMYEALTGKLPFTARGRDALYQQVRHGVTTHARSINREIPRDLEVVVETAMDPDPERRYPTALAFAEDLARVRRHEPIAARPAGAGLRLRRWAQRHPALATLLVVMVASLAVSLVLLARIDSELSRSEALRLRGESEIVLGSDSMRALELALAGDEANPSVETHSQLNRTLQQCRLSWQSEPVRGQAKFALLSQDGRRMLVASNEGSVQVWESASGEWRSGVPRLVGSLELAGFDFPESAKVHATQFALFSAAISPDGRTIAVGGNWKHAFVWRPDDEGSLIPLGNRKDEQTVDGRTIPERNGHRGQVQGIVLSDDGTRVWTVDYGGQLLEWQLDDLEPRAVVRDFRWNNWFGLSRMDDGSFLAWGHHVPGQADSKEPAAADRPRYDVVHFSSVSNELGKWPELRKWSLPPGPMEVEPSPSASFQSDRIVLTRVGIAQLWDLNGTDLGVVGPEGVQHSQVLLSPDGSILATADSDHRVRLWRAEDASPIIELSTVPHAALGVRFSPDGDRVLVINSALELLVFRLGGALIHRLNGLTHDIAETLGFSPDGRYVVAGAGDRVARAWDLSPSREPVATHTGFGVPGRLAVSPDGRRVAFPSQGTIQLWDLETGSVTPVGRHRSIDSIRFTSDGKVLSGGGAFMGSQAQLWDPEHPGEALWKLPPADRVIGVSVVELAARNAVVAALGRTKIKPPEVQVWSRGSTPELMRLLRGPVEMQMINHADVSPDGSLAAVACTDGSVRVWAFDFDDGGEVERGAREVQRFDVPGDPAPPPIQHVRFDASGERVVFGCADGSVIIGTIADGSMRWMGTPDDPPSESYHTQRAVCVCFADDDRLVLSASMDGTARVWEAATGAELYRFRVSGTAGVWAVGWIPARDGRGSRVVSASADGWLRTWILDRGELRELASTRIILER